MTDIFEEDDIFKFECEWIMLDAKKLTASTRPGAALIIFGIYMYSKTFKILIKTNNPQSKEKQIHEFSWDCVKKITIAKMESIHELTLILNKEMSGYDLGVVAAKPAAFEKVYEILNVVFFHLMNKRFKTNCAQMCKNIRSLSALETPRSKKVIGEGPSAIICEPSIDDIIEGMLTSFENRNNRAGGTAEQKPPPSRGVKTAKQVVTVNLTPEDSEDVVPECKVDSAPEGKVDSAPEGKVDSAPEDKVDSAPEGQADVITVDLGTEECVVITSEGKMDFVFENDNNVSTEANVNSSEDKMNSELQPAEVFDLYQILNVPSVVAIFVTLFINAIYFLFFNKDV